MSMCGDARVRSAGFRGRLVPRQLRPSRDGADRQGRLPLPPSRVRHGRHRGGCDNARPRRASRPRARLGARHATGSAATSRATSGSSRSSASSALLPYGAVAARACPARLARRPLLVATRVVRCRRARTSASTRPPSSGNGTASRNARPAPAGEAPVTRRGYTSPLSPEGRASLGSAPAVALRRGFSRDRVLGRSGRGGRYPAEGLGPPGSGTLGRLLADWQSCSDGGSELVDSSRSQYREFFVVCNALHGDEDDDVPLHLGRPRLRARTWWIQGFPKKLGSIWITRRFGLDNAADPGFRPGAVCGGTCSAGERRLAEGTVALERVSERRPDAQCPAFGQRPPLRTARSRTPRPAGGPRARPGQQPRPRQLGDLGGIGDPVVVRGAGRGAGRARTGARRQGLPVQLRVHGGRSRDLSQL